MSVFLPIAGTWGWKGHTTTGQWWQPDSPVLRYLEDHQLAHIAPHRPFIWTTSLNGAIGRVFGGGTQDWDTGGANLNSYFRPIFELPDEDTYVPIAQRNVWLHSHAIGVAAFAMECYDLKLNRIVSIGSPIRKDIEAMIASAATKKLFTGWLHVWAKGDKWQFMGEWFDKRLGTHRQLEVNGVCNREIAPKYLHSAILNKPALFPGLIEEGIVQFTRRG